MTSLVEFANSTSTWVGACGNNISALRQVGDGDSTQPVDATVRRTSDGHFSYLLKSATHRPYIRFTVPGKSFHSGCRSSMTSSVYSVIFY